MVARLLCCADIGGTNARLQLWDADAGEAETLRSDKRYATADFSGLEPLLRAFLSQAGLPVPEGDACSVGSTAEYAGPVVDEKVQMEQDDARNDRTYSNRKSV